MLFGWQGRKLVVDLSSGRTWSEDISSNHLLSYVGGRGLNSITLYEMYQPGIDPLGPNNPLIFGVGPLNGTLIPGSGRFTVTALSPLTFVGGGNACFGDSNAGGFWGPELKYAGYDQIVIKGRSEKPVYLWIKDDEVEIRDASQFWGKDTWETDNAIKEELGDKMVQVASIGPAGENLCRFAAIISSRYRANGKCGMGAVMGSKKLKAIVVRGFQGVRVADANSMEEVVREALRVLKIDPSSQAYARHGTPSLVRAHQRSGQLATFNYQQTQFDGWENITAEALDREYWKGSRACFACPLHCSHYYKITSGPYVGTQGEGIEYVTLGSFGAKCGNSDLASIIYAHTLCNRMGLDVLNAGSTIAWAMECWQKGVFTAKDTGGVDLTWGNGEAIVELLSRIALRQGSFGDLLAEGAYRAAKQIGKGSEQWVAHAKGQDPAISDPRAAKAWGLGYAVASRGGCHLRALPTGETFFTNEEAKTMFGHKEAVEPLGIKGKGRLVKWSEDQRAIADSLEVCKFIVRTALIYPEWEARFLNSVTGLNYSAEDVMLAGERIINIERVVNLRQGLTVKDDSLSNRFLKEPIPSGPMRGEILQLKPMLEEYYEARGWDFRTGYPRVDLLERLGLSQIATDLAKEKGKGYLLGGKGKCQL